MQTEEKENNARSPSTFAGASIRDVKDRVKISITDNRQGDDDI